MIIITNHGLKYFDQYNEETHNIYDVVKTKTYNIENNRYTDEHYYNKQQHMNDSITNNHTERLDRYHTVTLHVTGINSIQ